MDPDVVPRMCAIADDGSDYRSQATKDFLRRREALAAENVQQRRFLIVEFDGIKCLEADSGQLVQKFASLRDECMREGEVAEDL